MLLRPGSVGEEVKELQSFLKKLGYKVTSVDGDYGPETKAAVSAFQKDNGIYVDGWAGKHTFLFLEKKGFVPSKDRGNAVSQVLLNDFIKALKEESIKFEGFIEIKSNSEWDDPDVFGLQKKESDELKKDMLRVKWWSPGAAYCAGFVGAMVLRSLKKCNLSPDEFLKFWTAHVMTNVRELKEKSILSIVPSLGSIWMAKFGSTDSGHTGIVIDIQGDNLITIEGNTSDGDTKDPNKQRAGDGIYKRKFNKIGRGVLKTQGFLSAENILKFFVS